MFIPTKYIQSEEDSPFSNEALYGTHQTPMPQNRSIFKNLRYRIAPIPQGASKAKFMGDILPIDPVMQKHCHIWGRQQAS